MVNKETALQKITALVARFTEQIGSYKHSDYNETLTRRDFIDPFFKALGWDMDNEQGYAEAYREVIHEDKLKIGSATKAPDYSFRLPGGKRLFFVEAKKPSVFVKEEIPPAYQVRRYGWSAKLPISIVTDFEEFSVYDCTKKPKQNDKASNARIKYLTYKDYLTEFDFLWDTFSKERVLQGSFDKFVLSDTGKKGTATVDKEFLESLNEWRKLLAETISLNNKKLNEDEINFAVQQTLDRIIFLRIAEDRSVEPYGKLKDALRKGDYYKNLFEYFEEADRVYNSGLFDFKKDELSKYLKFENSVLEKIINELYYPKSPYEFSVLSVEILGSAYEQFLGKVIRLTPSHKAKIEDKPEVRKAGGVYYTPQYIVDYIVKNTVGKLVEGKTPKEVEKLKIVDPACGSGSFLIGAFQYLLDWHLSYYMESSVKQPVTPKASHPSREGNKEKALTPDGRLTTEIKKKILLNNIYGVDIDTQAVEVTKLSLLLKCMEGETQASVQQTMGFVKERVLPTLDNNIKCGNSLIDTDFYDGEFEFAGTDRKIKPFNWQSTFPEVFKQGGFDCVIGNPPYVNIENLDTKSKNYFFKKYKYCIGRTDLYIVFIEKNLLNLKKGGLLSYIIPFAFTNQKYGTLLREYLIKNYIINEIVDTSNYFVFDNAIVKNIILTVKNATDIKNDTNIKVSYSKTYFIEKKFNEHNIKQELFLELKDYRLETKPNIKNFKLYKKLWVNSISFSDICLVAYGARLNHRDKKIGKEYYLHDNYKKGFKPFLEGKNINRYSYIQNGWLNYIPNEHYNPMFRELFENDKLICINVVKDRLRFAFDNGKNYNSHTVLNCIRIDKLTEATHTSAKKIVRTADWKNSKNYHYYYLLGNLNSFLINWYFVNYLSESLHFYPNDAKSLPIPKIDFTKPIEKQKHDEMVKLVDRMLELNKELQKVKLPGERESLQQRIDHTDRRIDRLVYELYGLTEEEIKVVEGV